MNNTFEKMVEQLGEALEQREKNIIRQEGFFRVDMSKVMGTPLFYGSIFVDPITPRIVFLESLPLAALRQDQIDMIRAVNAVNLRLKSGKFYLTPANFSHGDNRVMYENALSCASGEATDDDAEFIIKESMGELGKYSVGLLRILDGSVSVEEFINSI